MGFKGHRLSYKRPKKRFKNIVKKMYRCDKCGANTKLPFSPKGIKPVYCNKCFKKGSK